MFNLVNDYEESENGTRDKSTFNILSLLHPEKYNSDGTSTNNARGVSNNNN